MRVLIKVHDIVHFQVPHKFTEALVNHKLDNLIFWISSDLYEIEDVWLQSVIVLIKSCFKIDHYICMMNILMTIINSMNNHSKC